MTDWEAWKLVYMVLFFREDFVRLYCLTHRRCFVGLGYIGYISLIFSLFIVVILAFVVIHNFLCLIVLNYCATLFAPSLAHWMTSLRE